MTSTASQQKFPNGSLLSSAVDVRNLPESNIKACFYGGNGVGKTSLACEFSKPLLLISFEPQREGGANSVRNKEGVKFIRITKPADAIRLAEELKSDTYFKTHVIDGATSLQDVVLTELMELDEVPVTLMWGTVPDEVYRQRSEKAKEILRKFLNLNVNTIVLAKEKDHNPPKGERKAKMIRQMESESFFASDVGPATAGFLHDACNVICRMYVDKEVREKVTVMEIAGTKEENIEYIETGKIVHRLRTLQHHNYAARIQTHMLGTVPEYVEGESPKILYDKLMSIIKGTYKQEKK